MNAETANRHYVLGDSRDELARLEQQAALFSEETDETLRRAGVGPGMRVLDLGCGVGDVSLAASRLVGEHGFVLGIDRSTEAVTTARRRMAGLGIGWVEFREADVFDLAVDGFDAVIGRFILMHLPEPAEVLRRVCRRVKPGGSVAFIEMDISSTSISPPMPLFDRCLRVVIDVYNKAGMVPDMGSRLYATFRQAGLSPALNGSCKVEGGPESKAFDYLARTVKSLLPSIKEHRLYADEFEPDSLAERLIAEARRADYCVAYPRLIGAWSRV